MLQFDDGVTELSFLLAVHDDRMSEGDETAMIELIRPRGGASLGSQRRALLTVIDDDMNRASAFFSLLRSDCTATAGNASSTVILAHNGRGTQMQMGGDVFLVELEPIFFSTTSHVDPFASIEAALHRRLKLGDQCDVRHGKWHVLRLMDCEKDRYLQATCVDASNGWPQGRIPSWLEPYGKESGGPY